MSLLTTAAAFIWLNDCGGWLARSHQKDAREPLLMFYILLPQQNNVLVSHTTIMRW